MEGEEVVVETEVVEVEKTLGPMGSESSTGRYGRRGMGRVYTLARVGCEGGRVLDGFSRL